MVFISAKYGRFYGWRVQHGDVEIFFGGKGPPLDREATLRELLPPQVPSAWLRQVHSAAVIDAQPGENGAGDALVTDQVGLALSVVTADCVPVLLARGRWLAAVHAGWRGLVQEILPETLGRMSPSTASVFAWIGPAIGPCCYEVGRDVADKVASVSAAEVVSERGNGRPHLDLAAAARAQLESRGVTKIFTVDACTRCADVRLWSYRREGPRAGRNTAMIWRQPADE